MNAQTTIQTQVSGTHSVQLPPETTKPTNSKRQFRKVTDSRGHSIRGLWQRNQRFYAQLRAPGKKSSVKVPLVDSTGAALRTVVQARAALHDLLKQRREQSLPVLKRTPRLADWVNTYTEWLKKAGLKHPLTISKEAGALENWTTLHGHIRLAHFRQSHVNDFIGWRKSNHQVSNRTINLDVIALNNCLRHAIDEGLLLRLPTEKWRPLKHRTRRRSLWAADQIEQVCQAALQQGEPGQVLAGFIRFLSLSGARRNEALNVTWTDVDWGGRRIALRKTKFGRPRHVDMTFALESLLREIETRRSPMAEYLFTPVGSSIETAARWVQTALEKARFAAALPAFCFHDLRHYFISTCVMAGIDYLTIAQWVGHRDGGILIGKVYGHLNDDHTKRMAERLGAFQQQQEAA